MKYSSPILTRVVASILLLAFLLQPQSSASALTTLSITPITWNVIGLDSNNVNVGPNNFPVAVRVCNTGSEPATNVTAVFNWDSSNALVNVRPGTLSSVNVGTLATSACADAYFEVEVTRNSSAYDTTRDYHISVTAGNVSGIINTPIRQLYVEHLVSQNRNATTNVEFGASLGTLASVPAGETMNLMVGNTYFIRLTGFTATQGYEQLESFLNIPNVIFQTLSVSTTYTADSSATVSSPNDKLYGDACIWENNQTDPDYRSCTSTGKVGGNITITYQVRILQVPGSPLVNPQPLSSLIYDFSGSSYHYNSDYSVSTRYANIINASIEKSFSPKTITPGSNSTLTFTINNPGSTSISNVNFTDDLPTNVNLANANVTYSGCGSPSPTSGSLTDPMSFTNITVNGNSTCTITVTTTSSTNGTYNNTTSTLKIDTTDTLDTASDTLIVSSAPTPPNSCTTRTEMARWTFENYSALAGNTITSGDNGPFDASSDVLINTPTGTYVSQGSSASAIIDSDLAVPASWTVPSTGNTTTVWGIRNAWPTAAPADITNPTSPFFQFQVNTDSLYGGVGIALDYNLITSGAWSNSGPWYILFSTNGTTWSNLSPSTPPAGIDGTWDKGSWVVTPDVDTINANSTSTSSIVYFRLYFVGANNSQITDAHAYIDNVIISGCATPPPPDISKSFGTDPVSVGSNSTLTFTISNTTSGNSALTGVNFTDVLPGGVLIASTPSLTNTCGGTATATANTSTISLSGGSLAANATCTISVSVRGVTAGSYTNTSTNISSTQTGANTSTTPNVGFAQDTIVVISPPVIQKSFTANPIFTGNTTTLLFSINNPNASTTLTGISFTDTLPAGLDVTNGSSSQCGGTLTLTNNSPAADTVSLTSGSLLGGATCSFSVTVTGTTAGLKTNTVTVSSTNGGTGNTDTADVVVRAQTPVINTLKSVSTSSSGPWSPSLTVILPGSVYYRFIVENTGDVALSNVNISDPNVNTSTCTWIDGSGATISTGGANFSLPVANASDQQIATCILGPITALVGTNPNTVTADDNNPGTPNTSDTSSATYTGTQANLTVSKTDNDVDDTVLPGGSFNWTITVTNNGSATANFANTQVILSDVLPGSDSYYTLGTINETNGGTPPTGTIDCAIVAGPTLSCVANGAVTLPANASFSFTFAVNPSTTGILANTAIVDPNNIVTESNENTSDNQSTNTITVLGSPSISKSFSPDPINVGGISTLTFTITNPNTGTALSGVAFTDALPAGLQVATTPNATTSVGCGSPTFAPASGNTSLTFSNGTISASGTCTVTVDLTATTSGLKNNTSGNVSSTNGGTGNTASDTLQVNDSLLNITKDGTLDMTVVNPAGVANAGDVINYTITVQNTGNVALTGVSVSDPLLSNLDCDGTAGAPFVTTGLTITIGNSLTCNGSYTLTQNDLDTNGGGDGDIDNTATADSNETSPITAPNQETFTQAPSFTIDKVITSSGPYNSAGDTINYQIMLTNTGNITLTGVTISDPLLGTLSCAPTQPGSVAPAGTMVCTGSYSITQTDLNNNGGGDGDIDNTATGDSNETSSQTDSEAASLTITSSLNIIKEVSTDNSTWNDTSVTVTVGDTVYYRVRVQNTGNTTLTNLVVNDGMAGCTLVRGTDITGNNDNVFEISEEWVYTCSITAVVGTNNNTATADSTETPQDSDNASYTANTVSTPALNITKAGTLDMTVITPNSQANAGDVINYTIIVQNIGNQDLTGVSVSDPLLSNLDCDGTAGAPFITTGLTITIGNSLTCIGSYTLTQNDLNTNGEGDGDIDNTATADSNETGPDTDTEQVLVPLAPAIQVDKILQSSSFTNPTTLSLIYLINVANTGNVALTNIQLTDDLVAAFPGATSFSVFTHFSSGSTPLTINNAFDGDTDQNVLAGTDTLQVGESGQITLIVYVDTGGDEDTYVNTAAGTGTPPTGPDVTDNGTTGAPSFVDPALAKTANLNEVSVGEQVVFTITVTNNGNLPAPDVVVVDPLPAQFDVTNVTVTGGPAGTVTTINPPVGGTAPFTVTVEIGGPPGAGNNPLGTTDIVVIQITTIVNSLGNPPIANNATLTTTAQTDNLLNNAAIAPLTILSPSTGGAIPALPNTGFAPNRITKLPVQPDELAYTATDVILEIPSLNLKMPVVGVPLKKNGWDVTWITNQAGWLEGSAFPSWNGNSVLTSHVTLANGLSGPFASLGKLKYGDQIIVHANGQKYIFEIRTNITVAPNNKTYFRHEDLPWLTLITCKEYDEDTNTYKKRIVVRAVLVEVVDE